MPRALLSVTDKAGLPEFGAGLASLGYELVSTGGTAKSLREAGLAVVDVGTVTGFPEMLDGRIKTLHPNIHGGLLGDVRLESHRQQMEAAGLTPIDLVCVNLYAFEATVSGEHTFEEAIESIDIGGPAMIRAAAKNHANVAVVVDPSDYGAVLEALRAGEIAALRPKLAAKAFRHTAFYDSVIARYLTEAVADPWPQETCTIGARWDGRPLRYGENPHQTAARFLDPLQPASLQPWQRDAGKEISYNNWLDAEAAWELVCDLPPGACAIIKHGNPCGVAVGGDLGESYRLARASDPVSAFGGIVAFHGRIDSAAIAAMTEKGNFLEVVIGSGWESTDLYDRFVEGSAWTRNVRFLVGEPQTTAKGYRNFRSLRGAYLVQDSDEPPDENWQVATARPPTAQEWEALRFIWRIVPHVKSNAIVVGSTGRMLGVGAGQMNRVQSVRLALEQAGGAARGAALASDAFFPFPDSIETAAAAGISAVIQPGGSKKDEEVVAAADRLGIAMVLTGSRHFRH